jgi:hypothetical protein
MTASITRLLPSPQVAANQLGPTTQVPAQIIYQTDGAPAKVTPDLILHLRQWLDATARKQLAEDLTLVPASMRPIFPQITRDDGG